MSPRSSIMILKPPAVPRPSTGGAPKTLIDAVAGPRPAASLCELGGDRVAATARGSCRSWNSSSITYIEPKFGALAFSRIDCPAMADRVLDARRLAGDLLDPRHHLAAVRSSDAESGSCTLTSR